jgi:hypothetical protein
MNVTGSYLSYASYGLPPTFLIKLLNNEPITKIKNVPLESENCYTDDFKRATVNKIKDIGLSIFYFLKI